MHALQVIEQGFRTTTEEQDDAILWLTQSMRGAGGELSVLLTGHASAYAQQASPQPVLVLGEWRQTAPADISRDLDRLQQAGVPIYVVEEDLEERGLVGSSLHPAVERIRRDRVHSLYEQADQVWQW